MYKYKQKKPENQLQENHCQSSGRVENVPTLGTLPASKDLQKPRSTQNEAENARKNCTAPSSDYRN
jgi:uncharacterized protein with von Willebrand factor type A (vWA) domain